MVGALSFGSGCAWVFFLDCGCDHGFLKWRSRLSLALSSHSGQKGLGSSIVFANAAANVVWLVGSEPNGKETIYLCRMKEDAQFLEVVDPPVWA